MRYIVTVLLVFVSLMASGQDIKFMLSGTHKRKWTAANTFTTSSEKNDVNITFFSNFYSQEYSVKYKKPSVPQHWRIISGDYINDTNIILEIGDRAYNVEFSRTSNGRDFMTLTRIPLREEELPVMKTYYSELL